MPLTGRFAFRKSLFGKIVLRVEESVPGWWALSWSVERRNVWRDARLMDLTEPELRRLLDLRDFVARLPEGHGTSPQTAVPRRFEGGELPRPARPLESLTDRRGPVAVPDPTDSDARDTARR